MNIKIDANVKHMCNELDSLVDDIGNDLQWLNEKDKTTFKLSLTEILYDLAMKQPTEEEIKYLKMRQNSPNYLMRG